MKARYHGHHDKNHIPIANALRKAGFSVADTSGAAGFVDLVVSGGHDLTVLIEVKQPNGDFGEDQLAFIGGWRGLVAIVTTIDEAFAVMADCRLCVTANQKFALMALSVRVGQTKSGRVKYGVVKKLLEVHK